MPRARFSSSEIGFSDYLPTGVKRLLFINLAVFAVCYFGGQAIQRPASIYLALSAVMAVKGVLIYQVFTYMFVHFGIMHVLFNMLGLYFFGVPIEQSWGTRGFIKFYLLCGVVAGLCVLVANMLVGDWGTPTLGASGAIFGVLVAFGIMFPDSIILMFFLFPMKAKYAVIIYVAVELLTTMGPNTGVSTVAHLGGAAFGYIYLKYRMPSMKLPDIGNAYRQWKLQRAKKKFQVYMRKHGGRGPWVN